MNFSKIVEHCIKHKFLKPDFTGLSFLGSSLARRLEREWYANTYIQNTNAYLLEKFHTEPTSIQIIKHFANAKSFSGCGDKPISLVSKTLETPKNIQEAKEVNSVSTLTKCLPRTFLTLYTLIPPSQKMDEFGRLQRKRRLWWKSLLYHPEHLQLTNISSTEASDSFIEQKIEITSKIFDSEPLEIMSLYSPQFFENSEASNDLKQVVTLKYQRKSVFPWLLVTKMQLELAVWYLLTDCLDSRNKNHVLYLHNDVAPYQVGILNESTGSEQVLDLEDLRRLIGLKLNQSRIPVLPLVNPWTVSQCDARGIPYLVVLAEETLNNGICHIRSRNTSLKEEVHIADVVPRLKKVLVK